MIRMERMTAAEFSAFLDWTIPKYAADHVRAGQWKEEESVAKSRAEFDHLLPRGTDSPDQYLRTLRESDSDQRVGEVWYALRKQDGFPLVFVYWIGIDPKFRKRGFATQAFGLVEAEAEKLGAARVSLHVFGDNTGAIALYRKLGYEATNLIMSKALRR